jgi:hypothetical protein
MVTEQEYLRVKGHQLICVHKPSVGEGGPAKYSCPVCNLRRKRLHIIEGKIPSCPDRRARQTSAGQA